MIIIEHGTERALAFELLQFGDIMKHVLKNLSPSKVCDFLKDVCAKVTDFVTQCHVLNATDVANEEDGEDIEEELFYLQDKEYIQALQNDETMVYCGEFDRFKDFLEYLRIEYDSTEEVSR